MAKYPPTLPTTTKGTMAVKRKSRSSLGRMRISSSRAKTMSASPIPKNIGGFCLCDFPCAYNTLLADRPFADQGRLAPGVARRLPTPCSRRGLLGEIWTIVVVVSGWCFAKPHLAQCTPQACKCAGATVPWVGDGCAGVRSPRRSSSMRARTASALGSVLRRKRSLVRAASTVMSPPLTTPARAKAEPVA